MNHRRMAVSLCALLLACAQLVLAEDSIAEAKKLFAAFVAAGKAFDPAVADFYADDAKIENTKQYPDGKRQTITLPAPKYKEMIRASMPSAKEKGDSYEYFAVDYEKVGDRVKISTTRFSNAKGAATPLVLIVAPGADGKWKIVEEVGETRT